MTKHHRAYPDNTWGIILGGSSGFGLATAKKLAAHGMNLCLVHRDRRVALHEVEPQFEAIRGLGVRLHTWNTDAVKAESRQELVEAITGAIGEKGRVRLLLHSIAFGSLKPLVHRNPTAKKRPGAAALTSLADRLGLAEPDLARVVNDLFQAGADALFPLAPPPPAAPACLGEDDFDRTLPAMGTSLWYWVQDLLARELFAADARVLGLTSEGNTSAWHAYAAISAAKAVLESLVRSIAMECAPYGLRCNVIQAGFTPTPAARIIPGADRMMAGARSKNPFGRLTTPEDIANVVYLLSLDEAAWINGALIRADGGEHISGLMP